MAGSLFGDAVTNAVGVGAIVGTMVGIDVGAGVATTTTWVTAGNGIATGVADTLHAVKVKTRNTAIDNLFTYIQILCIFSFSFGAFQFYGIMPPRRFYVPDQFQHSIKPAFDSITRLIDRG